MSLFDGSRLQPDEVTAIVLRSEELSEHRFVHADALDDFRPRTWHDAWSPPWRLVMPAARST